MNTTIPCGTCGKPSPFDEGGPYTRCINCWEVEQRLAVYLKSLGGRTFIRQFMRLDDHPDWDYKVVLQDNQVVVEYSDTLVDGYGCKHPAEEWAGWSLSWKHGVIFIGQTTETIARKAAAMFVSLWLRGVSASLADKLMDGFIVFLERQEQQSLTFLAEIDHSPNGLEFYRFTRADFCAHESFSSYVESRVIAEFDTQPDEEVIVTFTKRKK